MIEEFVSAPAALRHVVADMTPEQLRARPVPGRWSTLEVICHLADSDQAWCHRLKRVIAEHRPLWIGYDESRFTASLGYEHYDPETELASIEQMRKQVGAILRRLPDEAWSRDGVHNERGLMTLKEMVQIETEHVAHHIKHIRDKRKALGLPDVT
jgi:hypothetical protein